MTAVDNDADAGAMNRIRVDVLTSLEGEKSSNVVMGLTSALAYLVAQVGDKEMGITIITEALRDFVPYFEKATTEVPS